MNEKDYTLIERVHIGLCHTFYELNLQYVIWKEDDEKNLYETLERRCKKRKQRQSENG